MNSKVSMMKSMVVAVALAAGVAGMARADDSSMNPFTGGSYAYFNGGDLPQHGKPVFDKAPSAWRQSNPNGVSERVFQAYSGTGEEWHLNQPVFDDGPSSWRQAHPNGLSEREFQALSSEASAWHSSTLSPTSALASTNETPIVTSAVR
jgi:hypothetical protein